jgi:hypothetical protein
MFLAYQGKAPGDAFMNLGDDFQAARESSLAFGDENLVTIEVTPRTWRRSSYCDAGSCVEVIVAEHAVYVQDSAGETDAVLAFTPRSWQAFVNGIKADAFD